MDSEYHLGLLAQATNNESVTRPGQCREAKLIDDIQNGLHSLSTLTALSILWVIITIITIIRIILIYSNYLINDINKD